MSKIRIAFVASTFALGGAERVTESLVSRLDRGRFEATWFFLRGAGVIGRSLFQTGYGGAEHLQRSRYDAAVLPRLVRHFRSWKPDVLFCMDHHNAMLWGRMAAVVAGIRGVVVASHSTGLFGRDRSFRRRDRILMEFTDRVVALSETHARYLRDVEGIPAGKIAVVENGVDVEYFSVDDGGGEALRAHLGLSRQDRVAVMVAALRPEKAHEAMLEAASLLVASGRPVVFLVVGDGPRRAALEARSRAMGLAASVRFLGARDDVARLLHLSDVLVLPSHPVVETLPLAVLEAMAAGVPVIASRVGSIPELIEDRVDGILISPAHAGELADGIAFVLDHPDEARAMAAAARDRVARGYSVERMASCYEELFAGLAG